MYIKYVKQFVLGTIQYKNTYRYLLILNLNVYHINFIIAVPILQVQTMWNIM